MNRRVFLQLSVLSLVLGCEKSFRRSAMRYDLGAVDQLLYSEQFIRDSSFLLKRDAAGWSVMSTRCSKDGCELSFQDQILTCSCCGSWFTHQGDPHRGAASSPLPYYRLSFEDDHLIADSGEEVSRKERFTTPEIEEILRRVRERLSREGIRPGVEIPDALLGHGSDDPQTMFKEQVQEAVAPLNVLEGEEPKSKMSSLYERLKRGLEDGNGEGVVAPTPSPSIFE